MGRRFDDYFEKKTILITGAASGIGRAAAVLFAKQGANVVCSDVDDKLGRETLALVQKAGAEGIYVHADVTSRQEVRELVKQTIQTFRKISFLFNSAGSAINRCNFLDIDDALLDKTFNLNFKGTFYAMQEVLPNMLENKHGVIINMASIASSVRGLPNRFIYGASKAAVVGLTKAVAADYVAQGIRCNAVCPGTVETPSLQDRINSQPDPVEARKQFIARQPMGRIARADEIAPVVVFLASDESSFSTGNVFSVDGGMTI